MMVGAGPKAFFADISKICSRSISLFYFIYLFIVTFFLRGRSTDFLDIPDGGFPMTVAAETAKLAISIGLIKQALIYFFGGGFLWQ